MSNDSLLGLSILGIIAVIFIMIFAIAIITYLISAYPIYKMAKKMGRANPWLAWIPIANTYMMFAIPEKPVDLFNGKIHFEDRSKAFLLWLAITYGGSAIIGMASMVTVIPILGTIIYMVLYMAYIAVIYIVKYVMYKDIYDTFMPDQNNVVFGVLTVFIPIVGIVMLWIAASKEPDSYIEPVNYN